MADPVNLNIPGFPYLFVALVFFAIVFLLSGALSPIEFAIRRHRRSGADTDAADDDDSDSRLPGSDRLPDDAASIEVDQLFGTVKRPPSTESDAPTTVYECRHCGTTLEAGDGQCPHCETATVVRYEVG